MILIMNQLCIYYRLWCFKNAQLLNKTNQEITVLSSSIPLYKDEFD